MRAISDLKYTLSYPGLKTDTLKIWENGPTTIIYY